MNFQFYVEKLNHSDEYKNFLESHKDSYPCSAFIIIDLENPTGNKFHIDFFDKLDSKFYSFEMENGVVLVPLDTVDTRVPSEIPLNHDFDFEEIKDMVINAMDNYGVTNTLQKIILSLQNKDGENCLVGTAFLSMLGLAKISISLKDKKVTEFEKRSFFDIMKPTGK